MSDESLLLNAIERVANAHPGRVAFRAPGTRDVTYDELWAMSSRIAAALAGSVDGRDPVCVVCDKSALSVAAFLGCLRAGHAFVPVDIAMPDARIRGIVGQLEGSPVLQATQGAGPVELSGVTVRDAAALAQGVPARPADEAERARWVRGEQTQYIIFTSGSTGTPKGIEVTANDIGNFMAWMQGFPVVRDGGVTFIDQASYSFDLSEYQLVGALSTGGCLFALPPQVTGDYRALFEALADSGANVWVSTPSFADLCLVDPSFSQELLPGLRLFLFCGEALHHTTVSALMERFPAARVVNTYGPTESTVAVTYCEVSQADLDDPRPLQVGTPRPGTQIRIIDPETGARLGRGETGEIVIVGDTVAKGYINLPEKTAESFFDASELGEHLRGYHTGDLGHLDEMGRLHCEGRMDDLVKLNGFRIELGDVERNLEALPAVDQAAVVTVKRGGVTRALKAFVVVNAAAPKGQTTPAALKAQLGERVPAYMVPRTIKVLDSMPLNANNKIDRAALKGK